MFDVTSETRDNTSVIILKSRLTLQVFLRARASLVTLHWLTTAPVRNITEWNKKNDCQLHIKKKKKKTFRWLT